ERVEARHVEARAEAAQGPETRRVGRASEGRLQVRRHGLLVADDRRRDVRTQRREELGLREREPQPFGLHALARGVADPPQRAESEAHVAERELSERVAREPYVLAHRELRAALACSDLRVDREPTRGGERTSAHLEPELVEGRAQSQPALRRLARTSEL